MRAMCEILVTIPEVEISCMKTVPQLKSWEDLDQMILTVNPIDIVPRVETVNAEHTYYSDVIWNVKRLVFTPEIRPHVMNQHFEKFQRRAREQACEKAEEHRRSLEVLPFCL